MGPEQVNALVLELSRIEPFPFLFPSKTYVIKVKQWDLSDREFNSKILPFLLFLKPDESVIPLDPRWNMQAIDIIRNAMDFDPQTDQPEQLFALLESVANK